jgi:hypothetical protein
MPSVWGFYPRFERSRGLNAKGLQSLGNSPGRGIVSKPMRMGDCVYIFRPAYIYPVEAAASSAFSASPL